MALNRVWRRNTEDTDLIALWTGSRIQFSSNHTNRLQALALGFATRRQELLEAVMAREMTPERRIWGSANWIKGLLVLLATHCFPLPLPALPGARAHTTPAAALESETALPNLTGQQTHVKGHR